MSFSQLPNWRASNRRRKSSRTSRSARSRPLRLEQLETRQMLSVSLGSLADVQVPGGKSVLVPLTSTDSLNGQVDYTFSSSDPSVQLSLVSTASKSLVLNVTGTDSSNTTYSGTIVMHLFEDLAPATTARIEQLVTQGYYNGLVFHRVLDGFVAQTGQTNNGNDTGVLLDDEFNSSLTYTSPGLLGMASRGPDTADAEFFITAIDGAGATDPIALADMPQFLDFRYTIFGQVVKGFDTFEKIMSTPVTTNSQTGEVSQPTNAITITSASLIDDTQDAVLRVFAPASFDGSHATITVTATNADNDTSQQTFAASAVTDSNVDPPFLGPVANQTTTAGQPVGFTLTSTDPSGGGVTYVVEDATTGTTPANASVSIDQSTGQVTLTPNSGFVGTIQLLATVRSATGATSSVDSQAFSLTVQAATVQLPTLDAVANQTTAAGVDDTFTLTSHPATGEDVVYKIVDASTLSAPTNVDVNIDQTTGDVTLTPHAGFTGTINLMAEVRDASSADDQANYAKQPFTLNVVTPTLGLVDDLTTTVGVPLSFSLASTDPLGSGVVYNVVDATTLGAPANVTVSLDQSSGLVTLTPAAGFTGTINLLAEARDAGSPDDQANYATKAFSLAVNASTSSTPLAAPSAPTGLAIDSSGDAAPFDGNGFVTTNTPMLTLTAETGATVNVKLNGTVIGAATESATQAGVYSLILPAGKLGVGTNSLTATVADTNGTSTDSTPLSVTYAPDYSQGVYLVPGAVGSPQTITIDWTEKNAAFNNEFGYFVVDSADGSIGGVTPGSAGYAQAALSSASRTTLFTKGDKAGATKDVMLQGGQRIVFYLIQNNTTANFLAKNPANTVAGNNSAAKPLAFFSLEAANPDVIQHTQIIADATTGNVQYNWEDMLNLGDSDFNDAAITVQPASAPAAEATLHAPGTGATTVALDATLHSEKQATPSGDVGVYFADDQAGTVGGLHPGDAGYAAAALASTNSQVLFASGASGTKQITVPAGKYLAFYLIAGDTTADFLATNPTNATTGAQALFSFDVANPDSADHFRWYTPGTQATNPSVDQLHVMDKVGGEISDFDAYTIDLAFASS